MAANKTWDVFPSVNVNNIVYKNQFKRSYREVVIFLFFETKHIEIQKLNHKYFKLNCPFWSLE